MTKFKILAAALGLVLATGAVSASPSMTTPVVGKTIAGKTIAGKPLTKMAFTSKRHPIHVARHGHLKVAHKATTRAKVAHKPGLKHIANANITKGKTTVVR